MTDTHTIHVEAGPHHARADRVIVTDKNKRHVVTPNVRHHDGRISWASNWATIPDLHAAGIIRYQHLGPNTYGHTDCYLI